MNENMLRALISGLAFGVWPLLMNRGGLRGDTSVLVMGATGVLMSLPFVLKAPSEDFSKVFWVFVILAATISVGGVLVFNRMLASTGPEKVGDLFIITNVVQTAVPVVYVIAMSETRPSPTRMLALGFAVAAIVLLSIPEKKA